MPDMPTGDLDGCIAEVREKCWNSLDGTTNCITAIRAYRIGALLVKIAEFAQASDANRSKVVTAFHSVPQHSIVFHSIL